MKYVIGLVVVAIIVGFIAMQTLLGPTTSDTEQVNSQSGDTVSVQQEDESDSLAPQTFSGTDTLEALVLLGVPVECTIAQANVEGDTTTEGTFFVSGENMRGDFIQTTPGIDEPIIASMIMVDEMMYSWSQIEGKEYGVKFDLSNETEVEADTDRTPIGTDDLVRYDCKEWKDIDNSIFIPPSTVLFQDLGALFQGGMEYGTVYDEQTVPEFPF